jgi:hypothetical protein
MKLDEMRNVQPGDFCLVCGGPAALIGVFMPENPAAWGAPSGKTRFIRYCLCSKCQRQPDTPDRVEKIIRAELLGGSVIHGGDVYAQ